MRLYALLFPRQTEKTAAICRETALSGYVHSQYAPPFDRMRYGVSTVEESGCAAIACHNALVSLGMEVPFSETAALCAHFGLWLFGRFGTHPHALFGFCRAKGLSLRVIRLRRRKRGAITGEVFLYAYWNPRHRGIHTVEIHKTDRGYVILNHGKHRRSVYGTPEEALNAIETAGAILCLAVAKGESNTSRTDP